MRQLRHILWAALLTCAAHESLAADRPELGPPPVFPKAQSKEAIALGQLLFYDPILSGNRNISCATCHHPKFATSDGVSLSLGEGGLGLGPARHATEQNTPEQRLPRHAPALWNLGAAEFTVMFHDGRLEQSSDTSNSIRTPLGEDMVAGFDDALAAQAMFPVLSPDEMAGHYSENEVAEAVRLGQLSSPGGAWDRIAARIEAIPEYRARFDRVLGEVRGETLGDATPITFADIGNVLADFIRFEWRADDSPFDRYMRNEAPLPEAAQRGMALFYNEAACSRCHSGWFQTDHDFHAVAMPQLGPGKAARFENHHRDDGRLRVTGAAEDAFAFRTPSLRNVTLTAPYGHSGAYATLEGVVRHHLDPVHALKTYERSQALLPPLPGAQDWAIMVSEAGRAQIAAANALAPMPMSDAEVSDILAFLASLTDEGAAAGRLGVPDSVPSGLPVDH